MTDRCVADGCITPSSISDRDGSYCRTHWDEREAAKHAEERRETEEAGGPWPQTCPRRNEAGPRQLEELADTWDVREQFHNGLRARHCSYCGSLHPDDFMELVKKGWRVGATDKAYKAYLGGPEPGAASQQTKFYFQHLNEDQMMEFIDLYNDNKIAFSGADGFYRLPFFMRRAD